MARKLIVYPSNRDTCVK